MTTVADLSKWFQRGVGQNSDYMIVVCDTYDYTDYPVYVDAGEFEEKYKEYKEASMQRIMEVYNLSSDMEEQLSQRRAFNCPQGFLAND